MGGDLKIVWPESDIGMVTVPCPCGNVTEIFNQNATRFCLGDFDERAEWRDENISSCNFSVTAPELCRTAALLLVSLTSCITIIIQCLP